MDAKQLKAFIKETASKYKVTTQSLLQQYMTERFLERISLSSYASCLLMPKEISLKNALETDLLSTGELRLVFHNCPAGANASSDSFSEQDIKRMLEDIVSIQVEDGVIFSFNSIEIRKENHDTISYKTVLQAANQYITALIKLAITVDQAAFDHRSFSYLLLDDHRKIELSALPFYMTFSELLNSVLSKGNYCPRMEDYFYIYVLLENEIQEIDPEQCAMAFIGSADNLNAYGLLKKHSDILMSVKSSPDVLKQWENYCRINHLPNISLFNLCDQLEEIISQF